MRLIFSRPAWVLRAVVIAAIALTWDTDRVVSVTAQGGEPPSRPNPRITISKETTFITEPLTKDGYVDYLAALNAIGSKGVTPQNNAAVLLYQAFGPKDIPNQRREQVAKLLGIEPLPEAGKYFVQFPEFLREKLSNEAPASSPKGEQDAMEAAEKQLEKASQRPWSKEEFPLVAAWLAENEKPLEPIVGASRRPQYYFPLFTSGEETMVIEALLPTLRQGREAARALTARAMLRVKAGRIEDAWQDLLACHRLARLVGQGPTLIEALVGYAIENATCEADAALAHFGSHSAEQARRFSRELGQLPRVAKMAEKVDIGERFMYLDSVAMLARRGLAAFNRLVGEAKEEKGLGAWSANLAASAMINWDEPMRMGNAWYDRLAEAFANPTRAERKAALAKIDRDVKEMVIQVRDVKSLLGEFLTNSPRRAAGRELGRILVSVFLPAVIVAARSEDRGRAYSSMSQVAIALAAYRAEHGAYPTQLAQLRPKYLAAVPEDPFSNGPLRYKRTEAGYVLYSVGFNGNDDGGANRDSDEENASIPADADDIAIKVPWREKK